jgi:hypothetical protein
MLYSGAYPKKLDIKSNSESLRKTPPLDHILTSATVLTAQSTIAARAIFTALTQRTAIVPIGESCSRLWVGAVPSNRGQRGGAAIPIWREGCGISSGSRLITQTLITDHILRHNYLPSSSPVLRFPMFRVLRLHAYTRAQMRRNSADWLAV